MIDVWVYECGIAGITVPNRNTGTTCCHCMRPPCPVCLSYKTIVCSNVTPSIATLGQSFRQIGIRIYMYLSFRPIYWQEGAEGNLAK